MTLTTNASFDLYMEKSNIKPVLLVSIDDGVTTWQAVSSSMDAVSDLERTPEAVHIVGV